VKRPCEGTWRNILEWARNNKVEEFTHNDLLDRGVVSYSGSRRRRVWSVSSTLRRMHEAGLLTRFAVGKGCRASLHAPISREEYERKIRLMVLT
jgi:hypothetical protein